MAGNNKAAKNKKNKKNNKKRKKYINNLYTSYIYYCPVSGYWHILP